MKKAWLSSLTWTLGSPSNIPRNPQLSSFLLQWVKPQTYALFWLKAIIQAESFSLISLFANAAVSQSDQLAPLRHPLSASQLAPEASSYDEKVAVMRP